MSESLDQVEWLMEPEPEPERGPLDGPQVLSNEHFKPDYDDLNAFVTFTGGKGTQLNHRNWKAFAYRALAKRLSRKYGDHRLLFPSYHQQSQDFWSVGRVFNVLYAQHSGPNPDLTKDDFVIIDRFGLTFHVKTRPFVVVKADQFLVKAVMVTSYDGQGADKQYVNPLDLGSLYTCAHPDEQPDSTSRGVGFMYSRPAPPWKKESHIHYGHVATFDTATIVEDLGYIAPGSMRKFMNQYRIATLPDMAPPSPPLPPPPQHGPPRRPPQYGRQRLNHKPHPDEQHNRFRRDRHGSPRQHGGQRSQYRPHPDERYSRLRRDGHGPYGI